MNRRERGSHTGYLASGNSKGEEARGKSRHENNSERVARDMKERNVDTIRGKVPKKA